MTNYPMSSTPTSGYGKYTTGTSYTPEEYQRMQTEKAYNDLMRTGTGTMSTGSTKAHDQEKEESRRRELILLT